MRKNNPACYECKGKHGGRRTTMHTWGKRLPDGRARCVNEGCGLILSKEDADDCYRES